MQATFSSASEVGSPLGTLSVSLALSVWKIVMSKADLVVECTLEQDIARPTHLGQDANTCNSLSWFWNVLEMGLEVWPCLAVFIATFADIKESAADAERQRINVLLIMPCHKGWRSLHRRFRLC